MFVPRKTMEKWKTRALKAEAENEGEIMLQRQTQKAQASYLLESREENTGLKARQMQLDAEVRGLQEAHDPVYNDVGMKHDYEHAQEQIKGLRENIEKYVKRIKELEDAVSSHCDGCRHIDMEFGRQFCGGCDDCSNYEVSNDSDNLPYVDDPEIVETELSCRDCKFQKEAVDSEKCIDCNAAENFEDKEGLEVKKLSAGKVTVTLFVQTGDFNKAIDRAIKRMEDHKRKNVWWRRVRKVLRWYLGK